MTRNILIIIFLLIVLDGFGFSASEKGIRKAIPVTPATKLYDGAGIFTDRVDRMMLEFSLRADFDLWHNDIRVATFKSLDGENVQLFAKSIFTAWKMQDSPKRDAILIAYFEGEDLTYIYTEPKFSESFDEEVKLKLIRRASFRPKTKAKYIDSLVSRSEMDYIETTRSTEELQRFNLIEKIQYFYNYEKVSFWGIIARIVIALGIFIYLNAKLFSSKPNKNQ